MACVKNVSALFCCVLVAMGPALLCLLVYGRQLHSPRVTVWGLENGEYYLSMYALDSLKMDDFKPETGPIYSAIENGEVEVPKKVSNYRQEASEFSKSKSKQDEEQISKDNTLLEEGVKVEEVTNHPQVESKSAIGFSPQKHLSSIRSSLQGTKHDISQLKSQKDYASQQFHTLLEENEKLELRAKSLAYARSQQQPGAPRAYMLAVNYYEQQTMGSRNMIQLQCLAKHFGAVVVKPVMKDSFLRTPLDDALQTNFIKFEDSFDLAEWREQTKKAGYAALVEWEEFLLDAPRDVVLVQFNYPSVSMVKERKKKEGVGTHVAQNGRYKSGCSSNWPSSQEIAFLKGKKFNIVKQICFNFIFGDAVTLDEFSEHMLGGYSGTNVTVVMDMWRGMGSEQRVLISGGAGGCIATQQIHEYIGPSQRLASDADKYIARYLHEKPFLAVMGRLEMALLTVRKISMAYCFEETYAELLNFQSKMHLNQTFLSMDIGHFGTKKWRYKIDREMATDFQQFLSSVYGRETSMLDWESTFQATLSFKDAGYVGLLQKTIVSRARCVLFVGGGAFQRHALHLYRKLNPEKAGQCLGVVKPCTSATKLML